MLSKVKSLLMPMIKQALPGLKSAIPLLLLVILILTNVAIWWAGPMLVLDEQRPLQPFLHRAIASAIFTLSWFTVWGVMQWRRLARMQAEADHERQLEEDPVRRYVERQEVELNGVMQELKTSLNTSRYLYSLPWYLVMGLENAGKTSLINRSGQNFVFSTVMRASGKKSENPYSFDWWIGDDAVLIDPDGELLAQRPAQGETENQRERRLWLHFVQWLEKTRSRRPLNGVVLAIDVARLATSSESERQAYASLLRTRLRELMETLSTRLPVYIALTKLDLLQGFEPFFRSYTKNQREDVLGFTFSMDSVDDLDSWLQEFDQQFNEFIGRLNACLPRIMMQCEDREERTAIFGFGRQIAGMQEVLVRFLKDALASDQFSTSALVRGVYFTSVYQQGVPSNAFVDAASRRYNLSKGVNSAQNAKNSTAYFTARLFSQVIYPEAGLASDNFRAAKQKRRLMALSAVACAVASVMMLGGWHSYYLKNIRQTDAVLSKVNQFKDSGFQEDSGSLLDGSGQALIDPLNTIRSATLEFGFFREKTPFISDMGLYQGHAIGPQVEETYLNLLAYRYLPALMKTVAAELANAPDGSDEKLSILRVFRMLTDDSGRQDRLVMDYFAGYWQKTHSDDSKLQNTLMEHLEYALQHTNLTLDRQKGDDDAERVLKPYDGMITQAQSDLGQLPVEQRVYRNLKQSSSALLGAPLNVSTAVGPIFDLVFTQRQEDSDRLHIPRLLTQDGFDSYFVPRADSISELALVDNWVLGQARSADFSDADKKVLREKIRDQYIADYNSTWRSALNDINVHRFNDINHGVMLLDNVLSSARPFSRVLDTLQDNTRLFPDLPEDDLAREELMSSARYKIAAQIDTQFAELNDLLQADEGSTAYIDEVMSAVEQVQAYLKAIQDAPDNGKAALDATRARLTLSESDPIYALGRIASGLPKPFDTMMSHLADESWRVVRQEAIRHLEIRWFNDVYKTFEEKLASRYPFNPRSDKDVSLQDFETFFAPDGTLNTFYESQLKMFLDKSFSGDNEDGQDVLIRKDVLRQLEQAGRIRKAFFNRKGALDVKFSLEPLELTANKRRSVINVDGQYVEYSHGPRRSIELVWPNTLRESAASKLTLVPAATNDSPRSLSYLGSWAFFRLLEKGNITGTSETSVDLKFRVAEGDMSYRLHAEADSNPFTASLLNDFNLSRTLY